MCGGHRGLVPTFLFYGPERHMSSSSYHNRGQESLQNPLLRMPGHIQLPPIGRGGQPLPRKQYAYAAPPYLSMSKLPA